MVGKIFWFWCIGVLWGVGLCIFKFLVELLCVRLEDICVGDNEFCLGCCLVDYVVDCYGGGGGLLYVFIEIR